MADLQDNQAIALGQEFPGDPETSVTALLQRYRAAASLDDWEDYRVHVHAVCAFVGQPQTNFVDAQYVAWLALTV